MIKAIVQCRTDMEFVRLQDRTSTTGDDPIYYKIVSQENDSSKECSVLQNQMLHIEEGVRNECCSVQNILATRFYFFGQEIRVIER